MYIWKVRDRLLTSIRTRLTRAVLVVCTAVAACLMLISTTTRFSARPIRNNNSQNFNMNIQSMDRRPVPFPDVISQEEALLAKRTTSTEGVLNVSLSSVHLIDPKLKYQCGERIKLKIVLRSNNGETRPSGDIIKISLVNELSFVPGRVYNSGDGSYTGVLKAPRPGRFQIIVRIIHTREAIVATYHVRSQMLTARAILARYQKNNVSEVTQCHPDDIRLRKFIQTGTCNYTHENSDIPWYCGKPVNSNLSCADWTEVRSDDVTNKSLPFSDIERSIVARPTTIASTSIAIEIEPNGNQSSPIVQKKCSAVDRRFLWNQQTPTGFFDKGKWILRNCYSPPLKTLRHCLRNKTVYMLGDSTLRQWFEHFTGPDFNCTVIGRKSNGTKWKRATTCISKRHNFTAKWFPNNLPFYISTDWKNKSHYLVSNAKVLDRIPPYRNAFVVIHLYMHFTPFLPDVFKMNLQIIKDAVVRLLNRNENVTVFIKAPHSCPVLTIFTDVFAYQYINILYQMFDDVQDRVVFLNNMDATDAIQNMLIHPPDFVVSAMVEQMLAYGCLF